MFQLHHKRIGIHRVDETDTGTVYEHGSGMPLAKRLATLPERAAPPAFSCMRVRHIKCCTYHVDPVLSAWHINADYLIDLEHESVVCI